MDKAPTDAAPQTKKGGPNDIGRKHGKLVEEARCRAKHLGKELHLKEKKGKASDQKSGNRMRPKPQSAY